MIALTSDNVDAFVAKQQRKGIAVRWDGWTMKFFKANPRAEQSVNGIRVGGQWGFDTSINPNQAGNWLVNKSLLNRGTDARR